MKKLLLVMLFCPIVSCVNYDDDIRELNEEVEVLKEKNIAQDLVLDDLNSEISSIKQQQANDVNNLNNRLDLLEQSLDGFNNIVASLQASNTSLNSELASIQSDLSSLTTDVSSLTTDVSSLTTDVSSTGTSQSVSSTQASINTLDSQISVLSNNLTAALNRISTLEASNNSSSSTGSSTTITYTVTETVQLQIDWLRYFVPFAVNDSGWLQSINFGGLAEQGGLTVLFNHTTNEVNFPSLPQYSFPLSEQFRVEDESGNIIELLQTGSNWKASISSSATKIRFLYKYSSSPFQLYTTPYIEIKPSYNKFYVSYSGDITYSNISDTW